MSVDGTVMPRPRKTRLILALMVLAAASVASVVRAADAPVLVGRVTDVTDGDTIRVELASGPIRVRLDSIDAPERHQPWGREALAALYGLVAGKTVELEVIEQDRYDRQVAQVHVEGMNANEAMVRQGHAWAYREYVTNGDYCRWEGDARRDRLGLWSLPVEDQVAPWEWRDLDRGEVYVPTDYSARTVDDCLRASGTRTDAAPAAAPPAADRGCAIKGNIGNSGRIYHVPGSPAYAATRIDESKGERWFCTPEEAEAHGWRRPAR